VVWYLLVLIFVAFRYINQFVFQPKDDIEGKVLIGPQESGLLRASLKQPVGVFANAEETWLINKPEFRNDSNLTRIGFRQAPGF
jgi:hypothetical protein